MTAQVHWAFLPTSLHQIVLAASEAGVCWLSFESNADKMAAHFAGRQLVEGGPFAMAYSDRVIAAIEAPSPAMHDIALDISGSDFQRQVWQELRRIPVGETRSYGELATALGKPGGSRAVGGANAANNIAVLIPCHRVTASNGTLGGYAWGLEIKRELLRREGALNS